MNIHQCGVGGICWSSESKGIVLVGMTSLRKVIIFILLDIIMFAVGREKGGEEKGRGKSPAGPHHNNM